MPASRTTTSTERSRRRTGWIVGGTLAALAILIAILYAVDVL
jgi:hypothetical protein